MTRLRGLVSFVAIVGFVAGVPWLLVRYGDWPITGLPTTDQVRDAMSTVVSDSTILAVLTVAAWLVWAAFTLSLMVEAGAAVRGIQAPNLTLLGPLQRSARVLVAAVVLAVTLHSTSSAVAAPATAMPGLPHGQLDQPAVPAVRPSVEAASAPAAAVGDNAPMTHRASDTHATVTVERGDSAWGLAERHLGDGMRWRDLWALNRDLPQPDGRAWTDPQLIRPGWQLRMPADADVSPTTARDPERRDDVHVVVRGDTLSGIARDRLGDPAMFTEIYELNRDVEQPDGRRLTDPDLILPGWQLRLPVVPETALPTQEAPPTEAEPEPPSPEPDTVNPAPEPTTSPPADPQPTAPAIVEPPTSMDEPPAPPAADDPVPVPPADPETDDESWWASTAATLAGVTGAVVLASGLLLGLRRARQRRSTRGARALRPVSSPAADAIVAAADVPLVRWAGQALAQLTADLDSGAANTAAPLAIELSQEHGIELLWDTPNPNAPEPWTASDEGWAWHLAYDPDAPVPVDALPAAIPALVTIGSRDDRQLLIDLEAFGSIAVTGDQQRVQDFLRALAIELATGDDLSDAYVVTVDIETSITTERLIRADSEAAVSRVESIVQTVQAALDSARTPTSFAHRCGPDGAHLEATVVIAAAPSAGTQTGLATAVQPRLGVAVVAASDEPSAAARVHIAPDGTAHIEPLGITFEAAGVPDDTASSLKALVDAEQEPLDFDSNGHETSQVRLPLDIPPPSSNGDLPAITSTISGNGTGEQPDDNGDDLDETDESTAVEPSPLDASLVVKVLGTPRVPDRPNLKRRETVLTAYLACRGGQVNASAVQDALWNGQAVQGKTVWNLVGRTRTALGQLPDGTWALPPSDRNRRMKGLAPGVTTDLAILRQLYEQAQDVSSAEAIGLLRQGLALVEGPPFDADGYDWAHHGTQDVAEASRLIEQAAEQLVDLALDNDDIDTAREAITQGLRGLPGDEVLYRLRMRVEHHAGNLPGVTAAYNELLSYLAELEAEPSPSTVELHRELLGAVRR